MSSDSTLRRGEGREKKKKKWSAPSSPLSAAPVYQWHHSSHPPPSLPSLSLFLLSLSLPSQSIHSPIFFFFLFLRCPPTLIYPFYLPPSFRRHFSSSSPVAHPGVTRFSVAGGKRGGSRLSQEVNRRRAARKNALVMVTSRLRFRIDEHFFFLRRHTCPSRRAMALRHVIGAVNARGGIPRIDAIPERVTCSSSSRKHLRRVQRSCDFNLVTSYVCQQLKLCVTLHVCPTVALSVGSCTSSSNCS